MSWVADKITGPVNPKDVEKSRGEAVEDLVSRRLKMEKDARKTLGDQYPDDFGPKESGITRLDRMRKEASAALGSGNTGADMDAATKKMQEAFMADLGAKMGSGLVDGLRKSGAIVEVGGIDLAGAAIRGTRKGAKIQSPSRVFMDLGGMIGQGFADGIDDSASMVDAAIARMTGAAAMRSGGGGKLGGPGSVSVPIVVNVNAGSHASAEEIADVVEDRLHALAPGALQSALEQLAMQTGSAQ
jgi:hypothetical protein